MVAGPVLGILSRVLSESSIFSYYPYSHVAVQYSGHQDRQRRLIERLDVLRRMTQRALDLNTRHVSSRASEVVQLTEAAESIWQMSWRSLQSEAAADTEAGSAAEAQARADIIA